jgi:PAS domain S-box-containing protein
VEAILVCGGDEVISHIDRRVEVLLGYSAYEIITHRYTEILSPVIESLVRQRLQQSVLTVTTVNCEAEIIRKDGIRVPVEVHIGVFGSDERSPRIQKCSINTERLTGIESEKGPGWDCSSSKS